MYTIAYRLHRDGHIEPFSLNAQQLPTAPYFTVTESDDEWILHGHQNGIRKHLGHFSYQEDTEAVGTLWLTELSSQP